MSLAMNAVARGFTRHDECPSLVADLSGTVSIFGEDASIDGFGVLDIETAAWAHSETVMAFRKKLEEETADVTIREIRRMSLKHEPVAMPVRPPSRDAIESRLERLKRLLDKGLTSPQDAEEKRQEILEQL
jgi:hypothetical protein